MRPKLTIVRGLPGSGKTTFARKLAAETGAMLIEPDALMVTGGVYEYTPLKYKVAIEDCMEILYQISSIECDVIYCDVLPTANSVRHIIQEFANWRRIDYAVIDMPHLTVEESLSRNRHNVRREDIERMAAAWEPWKQEAAK